MDRHVIIAYTLQSTKYQLCSHLSSLHILSQDFRLLNIEFNDLNWYVFISTTIVGTQPHLNVIPSRGGKFFREPRRIAKGTARVQSTTALPIPEGIIWVESELKSTLTGSITEVVTPHIGWDGDGQVAVDVGARTETIGVASDDLVKSSCKSPDMLPRITSMCEANAIHIVVINCDTTIMVVTHKCIW